MPDGQRDVLNEAMERARRDARRLSADRAQDAGVYRLSNGTIKALTGNKHLIPGVRLEHWVGGERVDITHRLPKNRSA